MLKECPDLQTCTVTERVDLWHCTQHVFHTRTTLCVCVCTCVNCQHSEIRSYLRMCLSWHIRDEWRTIQVCNCRMSFLFRVDDTLMRKLKKRSDHNCLLRKLCKVCVSCATWEQFLFWTLLCGSWLCYHLEANWATIGLVLWGNEYRNFILQTADLHFKSGKTWKQHLGIHCD